jgi:signal peptidase II
LSTPTEVHLPVAPPAPSWQRVALPLWPAAAIVLVDQVTKLLVAHFIPPGAAISIVGDWVMFTHQLNPAGAMSIRLGPPVFYLVVSAAVAAFLAYTLVVRTLHPLTRASLTLVLAGAVGNMIDRIRLGAVLDFIDVEFFDFRLPAVNWGPIHVPGELMTRWPVFNVADAAVTCGIVLLIVSTLFFDRDPDASAGAGN